MPTSMLPFTLRVARHPADLADACRVRSQAYGRHLPAMAQPLERPDALDTQPGTALLIARDKASGAAVGTLRIQRNQHAPLLLEHSLILPHRLAERPRAEITRLAVLPGADPQVRLALMKACYLYGLASQVRHLVIGARSEPLIRIYRRLGFEDVLGENTRVPLAHAGGLPHRILALDIVAAERTWLGAGHGLYPFMVETWHPDIQLFEERPLAESVRAEAVA
ncbi:MAG: hypothetical protein KIT35_02590 [Piscinibacter sp.]|uniref:N-acyl amino acid synthase FeeM domain-containing protein n=1 Tax=Piscinibacter sp. TaxID=1903157 RepID=UPI002587D2F4|nr:hypothetical protein [Piscinibacter sp.]MCW5662699.1 hypothetical protein [Piscinibacter sp.]